MSKEQVEVVVDIHEPGDITSAVKEHPEVSEWEIGSLPAADIEVAGIGFERKTVEDYTSSIMEGRLDDQTRKLDDRYEVAYVLIDGDLVETESPFKSSMSGESLRGHMASLTAREDSGVQAVIPCSNSALLVDMAVRISRKHLESKEGDEYIPQPVDDPDVDTTVQMFACIDGVGVKTAKSLAEEFESIPEFVHNANYDSLRQVDGIGDKMALHIIEEVV